jgi:hypothetical protein
MTTANRSIVEETITELGLLFINSTSPLQAQPAENQKAIRSHAARHSHHQRWLQKCGITDSGGGKSVQKVAQRQRNDLQSQCQCPVYARLPIATRNRADAEVSSTCNLVGPTLPQLEPLPSIPEDARDWDMDLLPSLPPSNLAPSFLKSDWSSFGLPYEQCTCSLCGCPLPSPKLQHRQSRPKHTNSPVLALGTGHVDHFASLPIEIQPCMWLLIDHCKIPSTLVFR